jgi:hypothetical protein
MSADPDEQRVESRWRLVVPGRAASRLGPPGTIGHERGLT